MLRRTRHSYLLYDVPTILVRVVHPLIRGILVPTILLRYVSSHCSLSYGDFYSLEQGATWRSGLPPRGKRVSYRSTVASSLETSAGRLWISCNLCCRSRRRPSKRAFRPLFHSMLVRFRLTPFAAHEADTESFEYSPRSTLFLNSLSANRQVRAGEQPRVP